MSDVEKIKRNIKELERQIDDGKYRGERLQIAKDMLSDLKEDYRKYNKKNKVKSVPDVPIKALKETTVKSRSQMTGGAKSM